MHLLELTNDDEDYSFMSERVVFFVELERLWSTQEVVRGNGSKIPLTFHKCHLLAGYIRI